ncbi:hypothetical protein HZC20_00455 [Candidatus Peregrinibacteria bacterium]|nr:hypothetical protein [Candidatus Peregrinibacteria bacterium]
MYFWLLALIFLVLLINRAFPYFLHGPYGFGYDMGIYKKMFEGIKTLSDIRTSQVYFLPSFLAYVVNFLGIPLKFLLYYFYIFVSAFLAVPLYLLTKEYFGKKAAFISVVLFTISYVQVFASEFYLFKAILGATLMLFAFFYYVKKSYLFYLFAFLLAFTELPQLLLLGFGIFVAVFFTEKKYLKFHVIGLAIMALGVGFLFFLTPQSFWDAVNVVINSINGAQSYDAHRSGLFINLLDFLNLEFGIVLFGIAGFVMSIFDFRKTEIVKKLIPVWAATFLVFVIVFFKLFFENRFIMELDLLLIPFAGYMAVRMFGNIVESRSFRIFSVIVILFAVAFLDVWYYRTTYPALTPHEVWALDVIREKTDSKYVMVVDTFYAPWMYGFSEKTALAPGIFETVWDFGTWLNYIKGTDDDKAKMLIDIAKKYGNYYLFMGFRDPKPDFSKYPANFKKVFEVQNATVNFVML